jgi:translation initiation factor 1 (eIF-1/SUI1)
MSVYPEEALSESVEKISIKKDEAAAGTPSSEQKEKKKKPLPKIVIKRADRSKKKSIVTISGLEKYGLKELIDRC